MPRLVTSRGGSRTIARAVGLASWVLGSDCGKAKGEALNNNSRFEYYCECGCMTVIYPQTFRNGSATLLRALGYLAVMHDLAGEWRDSHPDTWPSDMQLCLKLAMLAATR